MRAVVLPARTHTSHARTWTHLQPLPMAEQPELTVDGRLFLLFHYWFRFILHVNEHDMQDGQQRC